MGKVDELRESLKGERQDILGAIWDHFLLQNKWITARELYANYGGKKHVAPHLEKYGGSIVFEMDDLSVVRYQLTFLGMLVSPHGIYLEELLMIWIGYLQSSVLENPHLSSLSQSEFEILAQKNGLLEGTGTFEELGRVLSICPLRAHFSQGTLGWTSGIPEELDDLPDTHQELRDHMQMLALRNYSPVASLRPQDGSRSGHILNTEAAIQEKTSALQVYVDRGRIDELRAIQSTDYDLTKLVALCEEINLCYANEKWHATLMLVRALMDHVPPIFGGDKFSHIANNYPGATSFKESMQSLAAARKIADGYLHIQIRDKEVLPNKRQVDFSNQIDVLLSEVVRILKKGKSLL